MTKMIQRSHRQQKSLYVPPARNTELQADLQSAVALHRRGQLVEAEQIYRSILRVAPGKFVATHLLGVSALQRGLLVEGEQLIAASA